MRRRIFAICCLLLIILTGCSSSQSKDYNYQSAQSFSAGQKTQEEMDSMCEIMAASASSNFDYYDIQSIDGCFIVNLATDGAALSVQLMKAAGMDENQEQWTNIKNAYIIFYNELRGILDEAGFEDNPLMVNLINDQEYENVLLSIAFGEIFYDCMAE